jgi:transposase
VSAANTHDSRLLVALVDRVGPVRGRVGRPRQRPERLYADKAYDFGRCRRALRARGISSRIARRGVQSSRRLGRQRWTVERTIAWLLEHRRLQVRYERLAVVLDGLLQLACALMCWRTLRVIGVKHDDGCGRDPRVAPAPDHLLVPVTSARSGAGQGLCRAPSPGPRCDHRGATLPHWLVEAAMFEVPVLSGFSGGLAGTRGHAGRRPRGPGRRRRAPGPLGRRCGHRAARPPPPRCPPWRRRSCSPRSAGAPAR